MPLLCPKCHSPIETPDLASKDQIVCANCGAGLRLHRPAIVQAPDGGKQKVGKFELRETIGVGAFGTVYKAWDTELERMVAVKVPRRGVIDDEADRNRFLREARKAAQLRHPGIVPIYEVGEADGVPFLVYDFVKGVTLEDSLASRPLSFRQAAQLVADIAESLQVAHGEGVVHGNLKPSNIIRADNGKPQIMDFGLGKQVADQVILTSAGRVLGTPAYTSPEQARSATNQTDGRSDIYSLGVILYRLLTGELPFRGNVGTLVQQILNDEPPDPRSLNDAIPRDLETICQKAMAGEPVDRYASAGDLAADLHRFLKVEPIAARPAGRIGKARRFVRRHSFKAGLATALTLLLLSVLAATSIGYLNASRARQHAAEQRDVSAEREQAASAVAQEEVRDRQALEIKEKDARARLRDALFQQAQVLRQVAQSGTRKTALNALRQAAAIEPGADLRMEFLRNLDGTEVGPQNDARVAYDYGAAEGNKAPVSALAFSPGERWLAFTTDGSAIVDLHSPDLKLPALQGGSGASASLAFGGHDDLLITIRRSDQAGLLWQLPSPFARQLANPKTPVEAAGISAIGQALATGIDKTGVIRVWNLETGSAAPVAVKVASPGEVRHLRLHANAEQLSFIDKKDAQWLLKIHDVIGGGELVALPLGRERPEWYALTAQLSHAAVSYATGIVVYDVRSGAAALTIKDGAARATNIAMDDAAHVLAAALDNGDVKLWYVGTKELLALLPSQRTGIDKLALSRSGRWLASGDRQGCIRLWDLAATRRLLSDAKLDWTAAPIAGAAAPAPATPAAFLEQAQRLHLAGHLPEAVAAYSKSLSLAGDQSAAHRDRGEAHYQMRRYDEAVTDFEKAKELAPELPFSPNIVKALEFRGLAFAEEGRWDRASADFLKALKHGAEKDVPLRERAVLRLAAGDLSEYGKICDRMLINLMGKEKPETTNPVVWTVVLAPATLHDYARVQEMAEDGADNSVKNWTYQNTLGAVLCRAGQYEAALERLNRSVNLSDHGGQPRDWLFLAIAAYHLNQPTDARKWLDKANHWFAETRPRVDYSAGFNDRLELLILQREAQNLVQGKKAVSGK